jgi:hypothetical protein
VTLPIGAGSLDKVKERTANLRSLHTGDLYFQDRVLGHGLPARD